MYFHFFFISATITRCDGLRPSVSAGPLEVAIRTRIHLAASLIGDFCRERETWFSSRFFDFMIFYFSPKFAKDHIIRYQIPYSLPLPSYALFIYAHCQLGNFDLELKHRGTRDPGWLCVRDIRSIIAGIGMWAMHLVWWRETMGC